MYIKYILYIGTYKYTYIIYVKILIKWLIMILSMEYIPFLYETRTIIFFTAVQYVYIRTFMGIYYYK